MQCAQANDNKKTIHSSAALQSKAAFATDGK